MRARMGGGSVGADMGSDRMGVLTTEVGGSVASPVASMGTMGLGTSVASSIGRGGMALAKG